MAAIEAAYEAGAEAKVGIGRYFDLYNHRRPHQALGYSTPSPVFGAPDPLGMWTIRVPRTGRACALVAAQRGEMLAFARNPTGATTKPGDSNCRDDRRSNDDTMTSNPSRNACRDSQ
ncbi:MAG: integrase core domain-containing protein [Pseudomonadota bacterium]